MVMMVMAVMTVMEGPLQDPRRKYSARSGTGLSTGNMEMDGAGLSKWKTALRPGGSTGGKPRRCPHRHPNPRDERRTFPEQREPHHGRSRPGGAAASARGAQRPAAAAEQAESEAHRARRPQSGPRSPPGPGIPVPPSERLPRSQRAREPGRRVVGGRPGRQPRGVRWRAADRGAAETVSGRAAAVRGQQGQRAPMLPPGPLDPRPRRAGGTDTTDARSPASPARGGRRRPGASLGVGVGKRGDADERTRPERNRPGSRRPCSSCAHRRHRCLRARGSLRSSLGTRVP